VRTLPPVLCALALASGCSQPVFLDQPIIGQADIVEPPHVASALVCDDDVEIGGSAMCTESCTIDVAAGTTTCGARVHVDGRRAELSAEGMHEIELTATVCAGEGQALRVTTDAGGALSIEGRALAIHAGDREHEEPAFFPEEGCADRTVTIQSGRVAILETGHRVCSDALLPFDRPWSVELGERLRSVELCFRASHESP
jgi:hypothetical protein